MIVREIKNNPDKVLENFDYFNDYKDTRRWLESSGFLLLCEELDKGHESWLQERIKQQNAQQTT